MQNKYLHTVVCQYCYSMKSVVVKKGHQIKARFEYLGQPIASQNDISLKLKSWY